MSAWDILIFGLIVAVLVIIAGLLLSAKDAPVDDRSALSESEMELLADFRNHPDAAWARGEVGIDNPS